MKVYNYSNRQSSSHKEIKEYLLGILPNVDRMDFERTMNEMLFKASAIKKIDKEQVINWLKTLDFATIKNPLAYLQRAFPNQFDKGVFDVKEEKKPIIETTSLFEALRANGIRVLPEDTVYIDVMLNTLLDFDFSVNDIKDLNRKVIEHMLKSKDNTSTAFIEYYKKAKKIKGNTDYWLKVEKLAKEEDAELNYILKGLEHLGLIVG
ncbi:MAG: hypothetical protein M0R51_14075 [Clostridia bacterium]|jgi:hypothetical protein|nr:hypothetical protein [Clostridia bacterium]